MQLTATNTCVLQVRGKKEKVAEPFKIFSLELTVTISSLTCRCTVETCEKNEFVRVMQVKLENKIISVGHNSSRQPHWLDQ